MGVFLAEIYGQLIGDASMIHAKCFCLIHARIVLIPKFSLYKYGPAHLSVVLDGDLVDIDKLGQVIQALGDTAAPQKGSNIAQGS